MNTSTKGFYIGLPATDYQFFNTLAKKMGWSVKTKKSVLGDFIKSRPKDVPISDDEILNELYAVRYKR